MALGLKLCHLPGFVVGEHLGKDMGNASRFGNGFRCGPVVPGQHIDLTAQLLQLTHSLCRALLDGVRHGKEAHKAVL